jgi:hypothetical protein
MTGGEIIGSIIALVGTGVIAYGAIAAIQALVRHYAGPGRRRDAELDAELEEMRARLDEGERARDRIAELEERLDFAERMLAQQREAPRISGGKAES